MYRYVGTTRLLALKIIARTYRAGKIEAYLPISEFGEKLMFEDNDDVIDFLEHCGVELVEESECLCAILVGQSIEDNLPIDKNNHAIPPHVRQLLIGIESKIEGMNRKDICRGEANEATLYVLNCYDGNVVIDDNDDDDDHNVHTLDTHISSLKSTSASSTINKQSKFPGAKSIRNASKLGTSRPDLDIDADDVVESGDDHPIVRNILSTTPHDVDTLTDTSIAISDDDESDADEVIESNNSNYKKSEAPIIQIERQASGPKLTLVSLRKSPVALDTSSHSINKALSSPRLNGAVIPLVSDTAINPLPVLVKEVVKPSSWFTTPAMPPSPVVIEEPKQVMELPLIQQIPSNSFDHIPIVNQPSIIPKEEEPSIDLVAQAMEVQKQREKAELLRLQEVEKLRVEQIERDRVENERRSLLNERARSEFALRIRRKHESESKYKCFHTWCTATKYSLKKHAHTRIRLYLSVWRRCFLRVIQQRKSLINTIQATDVTSTYPLSLFGSPNRMHIVTFPSQIPSIPLLQMMSEIYTNYTTPFIVNLIGPILQYKQNNLVSSVFDGSIWTHKLVWKCAIISNASTVGMWDMKTSVFSNLFRSCLCNNYSTNDLAYIGYFDDTITTIRSFGLGHQSNRIVISTVEACSESINSNIIYGTDSVILLIEVDAYNNYSYESANVFISHFNMLSTVILTIILIQEINIEKDESFFECQSIHLNQKQSISSRIVHDQLMYISQQTQCKHFEVNQCFYIQYNRTNIEMVDSSLSLLPHLINTIQMIIKSSALSTKPIPLLVQLNPALELETEMTEYLWSIHENIHTFSEFRHVVCNMNLLVSNTIENIQRTIHNTGKHKEQFAPELFSNASNSGYISGILFEDRSSNGRDGCIPINWLNVQNLEGIISELAMLKLPMSDDIKCYEDFVSHVCSTCTYLPLRLHVHLLPMLESGKWQRALSLIISAVFRQILPSKDICLLKELMLPIPTFKPSLHHITIDPIRKLNSRKLDQDDKEHEELKRHRLDSDHVSSTETVAFSWINLVQDLSEEKKMASALEDRLKNALEDRFSE